MNNDGCIACTLFFPMKAPKVYYVIGNNENKAMPFNEIKIEHCEGKGPRHLQFALEYF